MLELLDQFVKITNGLPYLPKAIFPSEMFMFYYIAKGKEVDCVIESGVGNGGSTNYLDALFPDAEIISVDLGDVKLTRELHPRIEFIKGDGSIEVPRIVDRAIGKNIGVLIDGPKNDLAIELANKLVDKVRFIAIHDLPPFDTHSRSFRKNFGFLDSNVGAYLKKYPNGPGLRIF